MVQTTIIVGGGVVGLNIALALAEPREGGDVFLLEREQYLGHHTSTRNSEVMHAGFAYPPDTLKAKLCVEGNRLSFKLFERLGVPFRRDGKWIVAYTDKEAKALGAALENAKACRVPGMRPAGPDEVVAAEPAAARPRAAAFSATSGIVDAAAYIKSLEVALAGREGVYVVYPCVVDGVDVGRGMVSTNRGEMNYDLLINAAGLFADEVYKMTGGRRALEIRPYKGEYYSWRKGDVRELVYPVPRRFLTMNDAAKTSSMGIHMHRAVGGDTFLGPTEVAQGTDSKTDYTIRTPPDEFVDNISSMMRDPPDVDDLEPAFAGNRPKLFEDGRPRADFEIFREGNVVHLLGIESPGLTAAPAIARFVIDMCK